jgi:hypothetical protein
MPGLGGLLKLSNVIERYIFGLCFIIVCRIDDGVLSLYVESMMVLHAVENNNSWISFMAFVLSLYVESMMVLHAVENNNSWISE